MVELSSAIQSTLWKKAMGSMISIKQRPGTFVLDPVSVITTLAMNAFKPIGTKLYLGNGILELHDAGLFQGTVRAWACESKDSIKLLNHPIIFACKHFFQNKSKDHKVSPDIIFLFKKAKEGLENLKHTYREDRDLHGCLNTYMNIIASSIEMKKEAHDVLDMLILLKVSDIVSMPSHSSSALPGSSSGSSSASSTSNGNNNHENGAATVKNNLYDELHRSWDSNKLTTVINMIRELETASHFGKKHIYVAIESFMMCIHEKTKQTAEIVFEIK